jgi:hypothetical protein
MSEDAEIEPRTVAATALAVRRCNHSARSHPPYQSKTKYIQREKKLGPLSLYRGSQNNIFFKELNYKLSKVYRMLSIFSSRKIAILKIAIRRPEAT